MTPKPNSVHENCTYRLDPKSDGKTVVHVSGRLDVIATERLWNSIIPELARLKPENLIVDAAELSYCDSAGFSLFAEIHRLQIEHQAEFDLINLSRELKELYLLSDLTEYHNKSALPDRTVSVLQILSGFRTSLIREVRELIVFVGEVTLAIWGQCRHPERIRWKETWYFMRVVGFDALPIILLIGFIMGFVLAFQSAVPLRRYGAELLVADVVAMSLIRELGPLMTAVILTGRSGSSFAAELGTMKVNEEINALITLSINPIRFLVMPRLLAAVIMTPAMTIYFNIIGIVGGGLVLIAQGIPPAAYIREVQEAVTYVDFIGGLAKSFVLGLLVAGIGCLRGLQTGSGAKAVGVSTTSAVVSGITLMAIADGIFSWIYYRLGI